MKHSLLIPKQESIKHFSFCEDSELASNSPEMVKIQDFHPLPHIDDLSTPTFLGVHASDYLNAKDLRRVQTSGSLVEELSIIENSVEEHNYPKNYPVRIGFSSSLKEQEVISENIIEEDQDFFAVSHDDDQRKGCNSRSIHCGCKVF